VQQRAGVLRCGGSEGARASTSYLALSVASVLGSIADFVGATLLTAPPPACTAAAAVADNDDDDVDATNGPPSVLSSSGGGTRVVLRLNAKSSTAATPSSAMPRPCGLRPVAWLRIVSSCCGAAHARLSRLAL